MSQIVSRISGLVVLLTVFGLASPAAAETCTWTGDGDGVFWNDADNWEDADGNPCGAEADGWITGQIILLAGPDATTNGSIKLQYEERGPSLNLDGATVGIENADGTAGLQYRYNGDGGSLFSSPLAVQLGPDSDALPVELASFDAVTTGDGVELTWRTVSETHNAGFAVERRVGDGAFTDLGFVEGAGTTNQPRHYRFIDHDVPYGAEQLTCRLRQIDTDGTTTYTDEVEVRLDVPDRFTLFGSTPNPVAQQTTIRYALPRAADVHLAVYDALGRHITTLVNEEQSTGRKTVVFDARPLPSGIYFVRLQAGGRAVTQRLTVVR